MRWVFIALLAACTTSNPKFGKGDLESGEDHDGSLSSGDAASSPGDLAVASCTGGTRTCGSKGSEVCTAGAFVPDRECPQDSMCTGGYCAEPSGARSCAIGAAASEAVCAMGGGMGGSSGGALACQPFVQNDHFAWGCARAVGKGSDQTSCATGDECRSGVCASNGRCLRACVTSGECGQLTCGQLSITVEGVTADVSGCK